MGKASYVGLQTGPTSYGLSWLVKVMNVSVTPFSYAEDFSGEHAVLTKDKLMVSFRAHTIFRVRGDQVKEFVEQYTTIGEGPNQVQVAFGNYLKEPLRTAHPRGGRPATTPSRSTRTSARISDELTRWAQEKTKDTPFEVMNVVVGNLQYPAVVAQAVSNKLAVSQDLETRATQVEIARKDAERRVVEAEGIARATQIIQQRLTPLYVQHEAIEAQKALVGSPNHSVIYIPVGPWASHRQRRPSRGRHGPRAAAPERRAEGADPSGDREPLRGPTPAVRSPLAPSPEPCPRPVYMHTLGCPKNRVDTEVMLGTLAQAGYRLVQDPAEAEVIVVNTCGFIESAKEESVEAILELAACKEEGRCKTLVVTGCLTQRYPDELAREMPEVDHFLGTGAYAQIGDHRRRRAGPAGHRPRPRLRPRRHDAAGQLAGPRTPPTSRSPRAATTPAPSASSPRCAARSARAPSTTWWPRPRRWPRRAWWSSTWWPRT